jgi:hypothetical protein
VPTAVAVAVVNDQIHVPLSMGPSACDLADHFALSYGYLTLDLR